MSQGYRGHFIIVLVCLPLIPVLVPPAWAQQGLGMVASQELVTDPLAEELSAIQRAEQYLSQGLSRLGLGLKGEALIDLTLAINQKALSPMEQARALYNRGTVLEDLGDKKHAAADYAGALTLDPRLVLASDRLHALNVPAAAIETVRLKDPASPPVAEQIISLKPPASPSISPALKPALAERGSPKGYLQIQLGAWRTEAEAKDKWNDISARAGDLLNEFTPQILSADVSGKGRYFRLRIGPMNRNTATQICSDLKSRGLACIPVNPS